MPLVFQVMSREATANLLEQSSEESKVVFFRPADDRKRLLSRCFGFYPGLQYIAVRFDVDTIHVILIVPWEQVPLRTTRLLFGCVRAESSLSRDLPVLKFLRSITIQYETESVSAMTSAQVSLLYDSVV
jgi:hypothetical protein